MKLANGRVEVHVTLDWKFLAALGAVLLLVSTFIVYPSLVDEARAGRRASDRLAYTQECRSRKANDLAQVQGQFLLGVAEGLSAVALDDHAGLVAAVTHLHKLDSAYKAGLRVRSESDNVCQRTAEHLYP